MSFCSYSGEFTRNMFTAVENQFITKYLPQANGDAVRVYLYGLYLCQCEADFDAESVAKLLKLPVSRLTEIFGFWEDCDLVHVLSREPLFVQYLPVNAAVGKPKPIRPEKYGEFNREFYKQLQKAGKDFKPYEIQKILEFLENNPMEQQAFLLVSDYCVKKDGEKLTASHILNKAAKLCKEHKYTYEQVEQELTDFRFQEREMAHLFQLLGIYRKPQDGDYEYLSKWTGAGMELKAVYACAESLKKGTLSTLDSLAGELLEKGIRAERDAREYLARREELTSAVFAVARKLGVKVQNPRPYADEYLEKWLERGYEPESLTLLASVGLKLGYGFAEMDSLLDELYAEGIVESGGVKEYCAARDGQLKLLQQIQSVCGVVKKTQSALDMIAAWRNWKFSDRMIMEAAKRSANASAPIPYMNKLLSEWKRLEISSPEQIPERAAPERNDYRKEAAIAADSRTERERHYAELRRAALEKAEKAVALAERDEEYRTSSAALRRGEIELAKAEIFSPENLPAIRESVAAAKRAQAAALKRMNLTEQDLQPVFSCKRCSDTGFLPDGRMCDCFRG